MLFAKLSSMLAALLFVGTMAAAQGDDGTASWRALAMTAIMYSNDNRQQYPESLDDLLTHAKGNGVNLSFLSGKEIHYVRPHPAASPRQVFLVVRHKTETSEEVRAVTISGDVRKAIGDLGGRWVEAAAAHANVEATRHFVLPE